MTLILTNDSTVKDTNDSDTKPNHILPNISGNALNWLQQENICQPSKTLNSLLSYSDQFEYWNFARAKFA